MATGPSLGSCPAAGRCRRRSLPWVAAFLAQAPLAAQGQPIDPPRVVKDINVIADIGTQGGTSPGTPPASPPPPASSFPDLFTAATKYCYLVAETADRGRELCRFVGNPPPVYWDSLDLFDINPGAGGANPDLLTLVGGEHLYFRASGLTGQPLLHHKDGETVNPGARPKVRPVSLGSHVTHTLCATAEGLLVLAFDPTAALNAPNGRVTLLATDRVNPAKSFYFTGAGHAAADLVDCGFAERLLTSGGKGFAAYRNLGTSPVTAWSIDGSTDAKAILAAGNVPFANAIDALMIQGGGLILLENNGATGHRLHWHGAGATQAVSDGTAAIQNARTPILFDGCLWFVRGPANGPHALWRRPAFGGDALQVPVNAKATAPAVIRGFAVHTELDDATGVPEAHLYVLGVPADGAAKDRLWRIALAADSGDGSATPQLCPVTAPPDAYGDVRDVVSLTMPTSRRIAFLASRTQDGSPVSCVVIGTEAPDDGDSSTPHPFQFAHYDIAPLAVASVPSLRAAFVRQAVIAPTLTGFLLLRAEHATEGVHAWRVRVPQ